MHFFFQKLNQSKYCADIGLLDPALFQRCFQFYSSVTEFLFMSLAQKTAAEEHKMKEFSPEDFDEGTYSHPSPNTFFVAAKKTVLGKIRVMQVKL